MSRQRGRRSVIEHEDMIEDIYQSSQHEARSHTNTEMADMMAKKAAARRHGRATTPGVTSYQPPAPGVEAGYDEMDEPYQQPWGEYAVADMTEEEQIQAAMRMSMADQQMPLEQLREAQHAILAEEQSCGNSSGEMHHHFLPSVGAEPLQAPLRRSMNRSFRGPSGSPRPDLDSYDNMVSTGMTPVRTTAQPSHRNINTGMSPSPPREGRPPLNGHHNGGVSPLRSVNDPHHMIPMASSRSIEGFPNIVPQESYRGSLRESVRSVEEQVFNPHVQYTQQQQQQPQHLQEQYPNQSFRNVHNQDHYTRASNKDLISVDVNSIIPEMKALSVVKSPDLYEDQLEDLSSMGFPPGLALELGQVRSVYPVRFWVIDNSGSMMNNDGNMTRNNMPVQCTRWAELEQTVGYHANLSGLLQATTIFRFLNDPGVRCGPQEFSVAQHGNNMQQEVDFVRQVMRKCQPQGSTPLTAHLIAIAERISVEELEMRRKGLQAVVVLATDGLPTSPDGETSEEVNDEFVRSLQYLQSLPVWVVIRLCTDDPAVVKFYNELDSILELPLEVLDDFYAEAKEINQFNKWLNYALPLHRCREMGYHQRIFDLLDERALNKDEIKEFATLLFGEDAMMKAPDVHTSWNDFTKFLNKVSKEHGQQWNPISKKMAPWIDIKLLQKSQSKPLFFGRGRR